MAVGKSYNQELTKPLPYVRWLAGIETVRQSGTDGSLLRRISGKASSSSWFEMLSATFFHTWDDFDWDGVWEDESLF